MKGSVAIQRDAPFADSKRTKQLIECHNRLQDRLVRPPTCMRVRMVTPSLAAAWPRRPHAAPRPRHELAGLSTSALHLLCAVDGGQFEVNKAPCCQRRLSLRSDACKPPMHHIMHHTSPAVGVIMPAVIPCVVTSISASTSCPPDRYSSPPSIRLAFATIRCADRDRWAPVDKCM